MLAIYLTWTASDILEVVLTMVMITVAFGIFAAIPFIAERFLDDRHDPSE
jgi:F0F1-type ATP synthase assembly protein I